MSLTQIESKTVTVQKSASALFAELQDFKNFKKAMPDSVIKFESDATSFLFGLKGMPEVRLVVQEQVEPELIKFKSASSKIDFSLSCHIKGINSTSCETKFSFEGNFNPMLKMMVERPLKNFIENLADKTATL